MKSHLLLLPFLMLPLSTYCGTAAAQEEDTTDAATDDQPSTHTVESGEFRIVTKLDGAFESENSTEVKAAMKQVTALSSPTRY